MSESPFRVPSDLEAEKAILGMVIMDNESLSEVSDILTPESFFKPSHQRIFRAIISLEENRIDFNEITILSVLKKETQYDIEEGQAYIDDLQDSVPSSGGIRYLAMLVQEHFQMRQLLDLSAELMRKARDPESDVNATLVAAEQAVQEIAASNQRSSICHIKEAATARFKQLEYCAAHPGELVGIPCGFSEIDRLLSGLIAGSVLTIAGRPSMGKSALAFNMATYISMNPNVKEPVLIFSAEMAKEQTVSRMMADQARVKAAKMKIGDMNQSEWDRIAMSTDKLSKSNMYIDDSTADIDKICFSAKRFHKRRGISVLFVDYLQLLSVSTKRSREEEVAYMSRKTKQLAKELGIPVVQLAQLNRGLESRTDKRPLLSDLRESGAIEQDSDVVMFIYRDEYYDKNTQDRGIAEILIRKHRDGPTGIVRLGYESEYVRFINIRKD